MNKSQLTTSIPSVSPSTISDKELYRLCQLYGSNAKTWLRKFAGLLPEVFRRSLYRRRGCGSIQEFAKKLSGMNERTVNKILNLHERLQDKPHLLAIFVSGEQGWSKLEAVAFLATTENEKALAEKVKNLPFHALASYVKNEREKLTGAGQFRLENNSLNLQYTQKPSSGESPPTNSNLPIFSEQLPNSTSALFPSHLEKFTTFSFPISEHSLRKL